MCIKICLRNEIMKYKSGTGANKAIVNNNEVLLVKYYY